MVNAAVTGNFFDNVVEDELGQELCNLSENKLSIIHNKKKYQSHELNSNRHRLKILYNPDLSGFSKNDC
jgi:hypothetical protein